MIVKFHTPGAIPIEAFSLLGINVKMQTNAIGRFGTGLKYAVAVILRHQGNIRLIIDGVEYEFYLSKKDFRGKTFQQVRMRKKDGLGKWLSSKALPFTTEFGKDWQLWQAYRELESNTRDEGGATFIGENEIPPDGGTTIEIESKGFYEQISEEQVFINELFGESAPKVVFSNHIVTIYDKQSKHLYYQGIRVYTLRYPARMTYDFKSPYVTLTEDRTSANTYEMMYHLSNIIQKEIHDRGILYKALRRSNRDPNFDLTFETQELNFDYTEKGSDSFCAVATSLNKSGSGGRSVSGYYGSHSAYTSRSASLSINLPRKDWDIIASIVKKYDDDSSDESVGVAINGFLEKVVGI